MFGNKAAWLLYEADKGTGSGETTATPPATTAETFTQTDVDRIVKERLEQEKRKSAESAKKAAEDAAAKALKDSADFKTLSEKQATALLDRDAELTQHKTQLETATQERDKYKKVLDAHVEGRRKVLPEHIKDLLNVLDPVAQMAWLDANADKLGGVGGVPATPRAAQVGPATVEELMQQRRPTDTIYTPF